MANEGRVDALRLFVVHDSQPLARVDALRLFAVWDEEVAASGPTGIAPNSLAPTSLAPTKLSGGSR